MQIVNRHHRFGGLRPPHPPPKKEKEEKNKTAAQRRVPPEGHVLPGGASTAWPPEDSETRQSAIALRRAVRPKARCPETHSSFFYVLVLEEEIEIHALGYSKGQYFSSRFFFAPSCYAIEKTQ